MPPLRFIVAYKIPVLLPGRMLYQSEYVLPCQGCRKLGGLYHQALPQRLCADVDSARGLQRIRPHSQQHAFARPVHLSGGI